MVGWKDDRVSDLFILSILVMNIDYFKKYNYKMWQNQVKFDPIYFYILNQTLVDEIVLLETWESGFRRFN